MSRARRVVNTLSILALHVRCLLGSETVDSITLACVTLYNNLRIQYPAVARQAIDHEDEHNQLLPGEWRQGSQMTDGDHVHARNAATYTGFRQMDYLNHYFNSPAGSVDWQQNMMYLYSDSSDVFM